MAIEDANKKMRLTETSLQEKDQRIGELDRLIQRMENVRTSLKSFSKYKGTGVLEVFISHFSHFAK